jgi:hypothetical protein
MGLRLTARGRPNGRPHDPRVKKLSVGRASVPASTRRILRALGVKERPGQPFPSELRHGAKHVSTKIPAVGGQRCGRFLHETMELIHLLLDERFRLPADHQALDVFSKVLRVNGHDPARGVGILIGQIALISHPRIDGRDDPAQRREQAGLMSAPAEHHLRLSFLHSFSHERSLDLRS